MGDGLLPQLHVKLAADFQLALALADVGLRPHLEHLLAVVLRALQELRDVEAGVAQLPQVVELLDGLRLVLLQVGQHLARPLHRQPGKKERQQREQPRGGTGLEPHWGRGSERGLPARRRSLRQ